MWIPGRIDLRVLWIASLAACASGQAVFEIRPIRDGVFNAQWPDVLRTRYQCDETVVEPARAALRNGVAPLSGRLPEQSDIGSLVCDLGSLIWPERVRAYVTASGLFEQWEFKLTRQQAGHPGTRANIFGPSPAQGRGGVGPDVYMTYVMSLEGPRPHLLRLVRLGS